MNFVHLNIGLFSFFTTYLYIINCVLFKRVYYIYSGNVHKSQCYVELNINIKLVVNVFSTLCYLQCAKCIHVIRQVLNVHLSGHCTIDLTYNNNNINFTDSYDIINRESGIRT